MNLNRAPILLLIALGCLPPSSNLFADEGYPTDFAVPKSEIVFVFGQTNRSINVVNYSSATVTIQGHEGALTLVSVPDSAVATVSLTGDQLTVRGVAAGLSSVVLADANDPPRRYAIDIVVAAHTGGLPPAVATFPTVRPTDARIEMNIAANGGAFSGIRWQSFSLSDSLEIAATISPDREDLGREASLLIVAEVDDRLYARDGERWIVWDGAFASLTAAEGPVELTSTMEMSVVSGLRGVPGEFSLFAGYAINGEVVYTFDPGRFRVE